MLNDKIISGWEHIKISDLTDVITGGTPSTKKNQYWDCGDIPWLPSGGCKDKEINTVTKFITKEGLRNSAAKIMPINTVVIALTGATTGKVGILNIEVSANQSVTGIIPNDKFIPKYMFYYLRSIRAKILHDSYGCAQKHISQGYVKDLEILLPPLETQKKISEVLEKAERALEKRKEVNRLMDEYLKSVFIEMFGDENANVKLVNDVVQSIDAGWSVGGDERKIEINEIAVLKISAVTKGIFDASKYKVISKDIKIKKFLSCKYGDILFSRANTRELVGASCIVDKDYDNLILPDKLWRITVNEDLMTREFFLYSINTDKVRKEISKLATGTSGSMLNISMAKFKKIELNVPSFKKQSTFSEIYLKINSIKEDVILNETQMRSLFNSLMKDAFNGKLEF
ncbi:MAG: restriction endonuclease subunit S [Clostridium sp.]|uniref:restriction endonuclease subunit S n=1 Tax=Clostridium sp. TaxID=1506 RepID=UPI003D6CE1B8